MALQDKADKAIAKADTARATKIWTMLSATGVKNIKADTQQGQ
jgi:hypothetical protein